VVSLKAWNKMSSAHAKLQVNMHEITKDAKLWLKIFHQRPKVKYA